MKEIVIHDGVPRPRFSIKALLTVMTLLAVSIVSYLVGREHGFHAGTHVNDARIQELVWGQSVKIDALKKERDALAARVDQK